MANNYGNSTLFPDDWLSHSLVESFPLDLEDVQPFNPCWMNGQRDQIDGATLANVKEHSLSNWDNDSCVSLNIEGNNLWRNSEMVYPRSLSKSLGGRQYCDLQNAQLVDQCSLQIDSTHDFGNSNCSSHGSSFFAMDVFTATHHSGGDEYEPRHDRTPGYAGNARGQHDYQQRDLREFCVLGGTEPSYQNNGMSPSRDFVEEPGNNGALRESRPAHSSDSRPSKYGFLGEPGNNVALEQSEPSFSNFGAWQDHLNKTSETPGPSSMAVPCPSPTDALLSLYPARGDESSSSSSSRSSCQGPPLPGKSSQGKKRDRLPTKKYNALSDEEKLARKRKQERISSKKHAENKRRQITQLRDDFFSQTCRNSDLQRKDAILQRQLQILYAVRKRMGY